MPRGRMTLASHSHRDIERTSTPVAPPISLASVHAFEDLDVLLDAYHGRRSKYAFYRRFGHENGRQLEEAMAALEGAEDALACSSGMSAVLTIYQTLLGQGGPIATVHPNPDLSEGDDPDGQRSSQPTYERDELTRSC